jgi:hypothetical protein
MDPEQSQKHVQPHAQINQEIIANGVQPGQLQLFDFRRIARYPQPLRLVMGLYSWAKLSSVNGLAAMSLPFTGHH